MTPSMEPIVVAECCSGLHARRRAPAWWLRKTVKGSALLQLSRSPVLQWASWARPEGEVQKAGPGPEDRPPVTGSDSATASPEAHGGIVATRFDALAAAGGGSSRRGHGWAAIDRTGEASYCMTMSRAEKANAVLTLHIDPDLTRSLAREARRRRKTKSEVAREILAAGLAA